MAATDDIRAFWSWWETARDRVLNAIEVEKSFSEELVEDISQHVAAIGDLDWELCSGETAKHAFCLSAKGDPRGRVVTELWRSLGPAADATWQYYPARQPRPGNKLIFDGVEIEGDAMRVSFEVEEGRERVHATYFHPNFAKLESPEPALFILLDNTFGEDGVERWLGGIDCATAEPEGAVPFAELRTAVDEMTKSATGDRWAVFQGETESGEPLFATLNLALKRVDHLLYSTHLMLEIAILDANEHGLPTKADAEVLNAIEDELTTSLGEHAVYFGRFTQPGRRILHFYAPEDGLATAIIERWGSQHPARRAQVSVEHDPTWELVKQY